MSYDGFRIGEMERDKYPESKETPGMILLKHNNMEWESKIFKQEMRLLGLLAYDPTDTTPPKRK